LEWRIYGRWSNCILSHFGIVCGIISREIGEDKGYSKGYWWGFFLLILGIAVQAVRPYKDLKLEEMYKKKKVNNFSAICPICKSRLYRKDDHLECPVHGKDYFKK